MSRAKTYTRKQLSERASLTAEDFEQINQCRRDYSRLGFAYQVGFVRLMNRFPVAESVEIIDELLVYTGVQLQLDPEGIDEYLTRRQTVSEHQVRIREYLGLKRLEGDEVRQLEAFLFEECFRLERTSSLIARANDFLAARGVLTPAESKLQRLISEQRARARERIHDRVAHQLPPQAEAVFDEMLSVDDSTRISALQAIKANPDKSSPEAILALLTKIAAIEESGIIGVELDWLNANHQRSLFHHVRNCSAHRLRRLTKPRRNAAMTCFLWQAYRDAVDQAFNLFDKLLTRIESHAQNELDERLKEKRRGVLESLSVLEVLATALLDDGILDESVRSVIYERIPRERLEAHLTSIAEWTRASRAAESTAF